MGEITQAEQVWIDATVALADEKIGEGAEAIVSKIDAPFWLKPLIVAAVGEFIGQERAEILAKVRVEAERLLS
jgi:hypothetical protein